MVRSIGSYIPTDPREYVDRGYADKLGTSLAGVVWPTWWLKPAQILSGSAAGAVASRLTLYPIEFGSPGATYDQFRAHQTQLQIVGTGVLYVGLYGCTADGLPDTTNLLWQDSINAVGGSTGNKYSAQKTTPIALLGRYWLGQIFYVTGTPTQNALWSCINNSVWPFGVPEVGTVFASAPPRAITRTISGTITAMPTDATTPATGAGISGATDVPILNVRRAA